MQVRLRLQYDGTNYHGWQLQAGQDSVQGRLEAAFAQIFGEQIRVRGSGRTDAGVHALGQVAAARLPRRFELAELHRALNAVLPPDIVVLEAAPAAEDFDPRRDARVRVYEYRILNQRWPCTFERRYTWLVREALDFPALCAAARRLLGEHDFAAFRTLGSEEKSTVRRVFVSEWTRDGSRLCYRVEASGFLRHMVRTMVAAMVEAGRGRLDSAAVGDLLLARDRARAPAAAPACGLFLAEVRF